MHAPNGFFAQEGGYEYAVSLGLTATGLAIAGPGRFSLDHLLGHALNQRWMVPLSIGVKAAITALVVGERNKRVRRPQDGDE